MRRFQVGIIGILLLLIAIRFYFLYQNTSNYTNGQFVSFEVTLLSEPQVLGNVQKFSASPNGKDTIFITIPAYPQFHYGDVVRISSTIKERLLTNKKVVLTMYFPKIESVKNNQNYVLALTSIIRQKITALFQKTLPATSASLLLGIVFGFKEPMEKSFMDNLRIAGVLHVIAASGMNVTMLGGFVSRLCMIFFRRQTALFVTIVAILFYATLAGLGSSIIRASIMGILAFSAQILGRQYLARYGIFLTGYTMLFLAPSLLFDIGFQLSFAATVGILVIPPLFLKKEKIKRVIEKSVIGEDVLTTIAAQIATLPILFSNFGMYSAVSILVNGLVLWTIPVLMLLGSLGAVVGMVFAPLGQFFLYLALPFLLFFETIVRFFGSMQFGITLNTFPFSFVMAYYLFLFALVLWQEKSFSSQ